MQRIQTISKHAAFGWRSFLASNQGCFFPSRPGPTGTGLWLFWVSLASTPWAFFFRRQVQLGQAAPEREAAAVPGRGRLPVLEDRGAALQDLPGPGVVGIFGGGGGDLIVLSVWWIFGGVGDDSFWGVGRYSWLGGGLFSLDNTNKPKRK